MKTTAITIAWICGMAVAVAQATDLTTTGSDVSKYMVGLGRSSHPDDPAFNYVGWSDLSHRNAYKRGCDTIENVSSTGNAGQWWTINDGDTTTTWSTSNTAGLTTMYRGGVANTYGGSAPDWYGYHFKIPAKTVTQIKFTDYSFGDGGPFAAKPAVQYLDAMYGTWQTVPDANLAWTPDTYVSTISSGRKNNYTIDINPPLTNVWGIRLYGNPAGTKDDDGAVPGVGFLAVLELQVSGTPDWNGADWTRNYARGADATPIMSAVNGNLPNILDNSLLTRVDTWGGRGEDYIGVTWTTPRHHLVSIGAVYRWFGDGGLFDACGGGPRVEYKTATQDWTPVTGLSLYRYPTLIDDMISLHGAQMVGRSTNGTSYWYWCSPETGFLFTFDPVDNCLGLRIAGKPVPYPSGDPDGFVGAYELDVFGRPVLAVQVNYDQSVDGDVDATDLGLFMNCWSGATVPYATGCADRDLDTDGDVDEGDFGIFQRCFSGSGISADPNCG